MNEMATRLRAMFVQVYGREPEVMVRAPGRINLIGEHTDYSLLPVLPLCIPRATLLAGASLGEPRVRASSCQFAGEASLDRLDLGRLPSTPWHRYIAGVLRLLDGKAPSQGAQLLVDSDLPTTGGLSSSSSFSMALLLCLSELWDLGLSSEALVEAGIVAERHVGVESGGMDQTVIGLGQAGAALRIDFAPLARRTVPLPDGLGLIAAYSGEAAPKGGSARDAYNRRVIGCRLAAALLGAHLGIEAGSPPVLGRVFGPAQPRDLDALPIRASAATVARSLGLELEPLVRFTASSFGADIEVEVRPVARHVLGEAARVDRAEAALHANDLQTLGELLDQSQESLATDFGCSTPALDRLCRAMRKGGALGARLTGAGFGGYAIAAVRSEDLPPVLSAARTACPGPVFEVSAVAGMERLRT